MQHLMIDAFSSYRSRLEETMLVYEFLEKIPEKLGLKALMPPFILPYFNGVVPEDCGISAFVFVKGGHLTIHTFSFRECYFADLVSFDNFNENKLINQIKTIFPAGKFNSFSVERSICEGKTKDSLINEETDFGPHLFFKIDNFSTDMESLFDIFDRLPMQIGMTPIMRPYIVKSRCEDEYVVSAITMIAESHIAIHWFSKSKIAYLDIFSCRFFKIEPVLKKLSSILNCDLSKMTYISRGKNYLNKASTINKRLVYSKGWIHNY